MKKSPVRYTLADFAKFCATLKLENGKPFKLLPYERKVLSEHFRGCRETVVIIPKKNGKTTMMGALAIFHLLVVPNAEIVIGAASRDQASILFRQAAGLVQRSRLSGDLNVQPGYREIKRWSLDRRAITGRIRVLAADSSTADGIIPTLALVDELHRHKSADLYGVFRDGLGPRNGQLITISTAGATLESPLGALREKAHLLPSFKRKGVYNHALSPDKSFCLHEWCLSHEDDPQDLTLVKQVNPAPWHTVKKLRERRDSPSTTPSQWARFACGIWVDQDDPWVTADEWSACDEPIPSLDGLECYGGLDLAATTDTTAFTLVFEIDGRVVVKPFVFLPEGNLVARIARDKVPYDEWARQGYLFLTPGNVVDYGFVKRTVLESAERYKLASVGYDRWNSSQLVTELIDEGIDMIPIGQGFKEMAQPMQDLRRLVLGRQIIHGDNPILRRHIASMGVMQDPAGNAKPAKSKSAGRIDAVVAMLDALAVMSKAPEPQASEYEDALCRCNRRTPVPHIWRTGCMPRQIAV